MYKYESGALLSSHAWLDGQLSNIFYIFLFIFYFITKIKIEYSHSFFGNVESCTKTIYFRLFTTVTIVTCGPSRVIQHIDLYTGSYISSTCFQYNFQITTALLQLIPHSPTYWAPCHRCPLNKKFRPEITLT